MSIENEKSEGRETSLQQLEEINIDSTANLNGKCIQLNNNNNNNPLTKEQSIVNKEDVESNKKFPDLMRLPIKIHNRNTLALLDSGSSASLMALSVFADLPNSYRKNVVKKSGRRRIF